MCVLSTLCFKHLMMLDLGKCNTAPLFLTAAQDGFELTNLPCLQQHRSSTCVVFSVFCTLHACCSAEHTLQMTRTHSALSFGLCVLVAAQEILRASFKKTFACLADHEPENINPIDQFLVTVESLLLSCMAPNNSATIASFAILLLPKQAQSHSHSHASI